MYVHIHMYVCMQNGGLTERIFFWRYVPFQSGKALGETISNWRGIYSRSVYWCIYHCWEHGRSVCVCIHFIQCRVCTFAFLVFEALYSTSLFVSAWLIIVVSFCWDIWEMHVRSLTFVPATIRTTGAKWSFYDHICMYPHTYAHVCIYMYVSIICGLVEFGHKYASHFAYTVYCECVCTYLYVWFMREICIIHVYMYVYTSIYVI